MFYSLRSKMNKTQNYISIRFLIITLVLCVSCGRQLVIPYSSESNSNASIFIKPIKPTNKTFITINDSLIVNKKLIKSVRIDHIPPGTYTINYSSDVNTVIARIDSTMTIVIEDHQEIAKIIDVPPYSSWYYISNILIGLLLIAPLVFL